MKNILHKIPYTVALLLGIVAYYAFDNVLYGVFKGCGQTLLCFPDINQIVGLAMFLFGVPLSIIGVMATLIFDLNSGRLNSIGKGISITIAICVIIIAGSVLLEFFHVVS